MSELEEMALDLCAEYGIGLCYASIAVRNIVFNDMSERDAIADLIDRYGDAIYE